MSEFRINDGKPTSMFGLILTLTKRDMGYFRPIQVLNSTWKNHRGAIFDLTNLTAVNSY